MQASDRRSPEVTFSEFVEPQRKVDGRTSTTCFLATACDNSSKRASSDSITLTEKDSKDGPKHSARLGYMPRSSRGTNQEEGERGERPVKGSIVVLCIKKAVNHTKLDPRQEGSPFGPGSLLIREQSILIKRKN